MALCLLSLAIIFVGIIVFVAAKKLSKNKKAIAFPIIAIIVGAVGVVASCVVSVPTGHTGVVATFGKVEDYTFEAGVHMKMPFSDVINMDNRTQKGSLEMS